MIRKSYLIGKGFLQAFFSLNPLIYLNHISTTTCHMITYNIFLYLKEKEDKTVVGNGIDIMIILTYA
jgi:hypothetical protein